MNQASRKEVEESVASAGLEFLGVVKLRPESQYEHFRQWILDDMHAGMRYLEQHENLRRDPRELLPGAETAIVFGLPYFQGDQIRDLPHSGGEPLIAQYARFEDYHRLLRKRAEGIVEKLAAGNPDSRFRIAVDSAPILERAIAGRTESGFIGKNTCFIHAEKGSFFLLGEILTTLDVPVDEKIKEHDGCGTCERCQVHCPTGALAKDYSIDANLCISYWTNEHRGTIPEKFWPYLSTYLFGCDICQLVCPYNGPKKIPRLPDWVKQRKFPALFEIATMNQSQYESFFGGTPVTRAKRNGLRRNALIAMAVTKDERLGEAIANARVDRESPIFETVLQIEKYLAESSPTY